MVMELYMVIWWRFKYLGDCYKLQVYALANYINRDKEIIPKILFQKHAVQS